MYQFSVLAAEKIDIVTCLVRRKEPKKQKQITDHRSQKITDHRRRKKKEKALNVVEGYAKRADPIVDRLLYELIKPAHIRLWDFGGDWGVDGTLL